MKVTIQGVPGHFDTTHNYTTPEVAARLNMTDRWVLWAADRHRIQGHKRIGTAGKWNCLDIRSDDKYYVETEEKSLAAEPIVAYANRSQLEKMVTETENRMKKAAKDLDFITAAQFRDEMLALKKQLRERFGGE